MSQKRVGVLVIHGIGEQRQFEHLEGVARNIASALQADPNLVSVQVHVNVSGDAAYGATQQTWRGEGIATAIIEAIDNNGNHTHLEFREVWWSDLDEPNSVQAFLNFWGWGLSLWTRPPYDMKKIKIGTANEDMRLPGRTADNEDKLLPGQGEPLQFWHRVYLFLVSFVVFLLLPLLSILGRALRSILGLDIRPDILVEYLGDVKLYQQDAQAGKGPLIDLGKNPPRVSIRRRTVKAFVEMALEDYDRWYVLSHSLGTVVAFNALMETERALPNYLRRSLWEKWSKQYQGREDVRLKTNHPLAPEQKQKMLPQRPSWLQDDDVIDRKQLFSKLKGFMTYGSPLSKFAALWPAIVPLNKDESVFRDDFEWINVFDPTDPVSDFTRFFDSQSGKTSVTPREIPYKAEKVHLLSHGEYLTFRPKRKNPLVRQVAQWLLSESSFEEPPKQNRDAQYQLGWPTAKVNGKDGLVVSVYFGLGIFIWFILGVIISFVLSWIIPWILPDKLPEPIAKVLSKWQISMDGINAFLFQTQQFLSNPISLIILTAIIVLIFGVVARLQGLNQNKVVSSK